MWCDDGRLLSALLLLLAAAVVALCSSEAINCTPYKGIKGEDIILLPHVTGHLSEIIWKKEVNKKFDKVAEWELGSMKGIESYSHWLNRADIDLRSGKLTIQNISQIDDGLYLAEAQVGGIYQDTYFCLKILEPPPAPTLTCNIDDDGIYVQCTSVTGYELPLSLSWNSMNNIRIVNSTEGHSRVKLLKNTDRSRDITCIIAASKTSVSNTISLMTCDSRGAVSQERTRIISVILLIPIVGIIVIAFILWKRGICRRPQGEAQSSCEGNSENQCAQSSNREDIERHQDENTAFLEGGPENKSNEKVHPENHTNESRPGDEHLPEPQHMKTSSIEDIERHQDENTAFLEGGPENKSNEEVLPMKPADECMPPNEAGLEFPTMTTSNTEDETTPES